MSDFPERQRISKGLTNVEHHDYFDGDRTCLENSLYGFPQIYFVGQTDSQVNCVAWVSRERSLLNGIQFFIAQVTFVLETMMPRDGNRKPEHFSQKSTKYTKPKILLMSSMFRQLYLHFQA